MRPHIQILLHVLDQIRLLLLSYRGCRLETLDTGLKKIFKNVLFIDIITSKDWLLLL